MTQDLQQKKKNRYLFLHHLYKESNGDTGPMFNMWETGNELNYDHDETRRITDYLIGEDLVEARALGGLIGLTHSGIKEVEEAIESPDRSTKHFMPINVINIGEMTNSSLQQGTSNSNLFFNNENLNNPSLDEIIISLKSIQDTLNISKELHAELISEIETLTIQQKSPRPKKVILTESLKSIKTILENVAGNVLTPVIVDQISRIVG